MGVRDIPDGKVYQHKELMLPFVIAILTALESLYGIIVSIV